MNARELLLRATGLNLSQPAVDRALRERMEHFAIGDPDQYLERMSPDELEALVELVVVPESWMFRDPDAFAAAAAFVLRRLARRPAQMVRILSIPCAGGEEPYSIAMALQDAGVPAASYRIEGVDLSATAIGRAVAGRYTRNAFRGADLQFRDRHFSRHGDEYQISEQLRAGVNFKQASLFDFDGVPGYDLVFCRNLLIYFDDATAAAAIAVLRRLLADDGILFAGYAEVPAFCGNGFAPVRAPGAFALQKETGEPVPAQRRTPPARAARPVRRAPVPAPQERPVPAAPCPPAAAGARDLLAEARGQADRGDYQAAADSCRALLAADADSAEAYFILGMVSECQHQPAAAADHWRRCVYLQPDHYEALCYLALLADQDGSAQQAAALRQRAARIYQRRHDGGSLKS